MSGINILVVDDHKIIRDGIVSMLEGIPDFSIKAEAENGRQALEICRSESIDLVIMDVNMPEMGGIEATRSIKKEFPDIKILVLTMMREDESIRRMIQAGASGYILKSSGSKELTEAIQTIMQGNHYFSDDAVQSIMADLIESGGKKKSADADELTERELEVLELICQEFTNAEIAEKLYISVRTVDAHRRNLLQKTGARNTAGLVKYAMEKNLFR